MLNKNLINIKNILKIVLSILLIASMVKSCAKASTSSDIRDNIHTLWEKGALGQNDYSSTINLTGIDSYNYYMIWITQGSRNEGYNNPTKLTTTRYLYIIGTNNATVTNYNNNTNNMLYYTLNMGSSYFSKQYNISTGSAVSTGNFALLDSKEPFYVYTTTKLNCRILQLEARRRVWGYIS